MIDNVKRPDISVVILCYRSGEYASVFSKKMTEVLKQAGLDYELVLVGNYKAELAGIDDTPKVVERLAREDGRIVPVVKEKKGMMGWDMRSGLEVASGKTVAVIDGDGQMPPEDVVKVYKALWSGSYDIAKTYRDARFDGWKRVLISKVYNLAVRFLFPRIKVKDVNSKPKIFKRDALKRLNLISDDWFIDAEIIIKGSYLGMGIGEAPTEFYPNENRPSFVGSSAVMEFLRHLIEYRIKIFFNKLI